MSKGPQGRPSSIAGAYPGHRARIVAEEAPEKPWGKIVAGIVMLIVVCVGSLIAMQYMKPTHPTGPQPGEDERVYRMMDDNGTEDLKTWLNANETRMVMGMSRDQSLRLAEHATSLGAKNVFAFRGGIMTMSVVVELPEDPAQRAKLFSWWRDNYLSYDNKVSSDVGQKYLLFLMHM